MTFSTPTLKFGEILDACQKYGYEGFEPRISAGHAHGIEPETGNAELRELKAKAESRGVGFSCVATSISYVNGKTDAQNIAETEKAIDLANTLGSKCIRVFGGQMTEINGYRPAQERVICSLRSVSSYARDAGVFVCMETHDSWCSAARVKTVMKAVNRPYIAVNWDIMHPVNTESYEMTDAFDLLKPWIRHVHIHDGVRQDTNSPDLSFCPIGEGEIDHRIALLLLRDCGYEGYVSGEWINWPDPWEVHLPREIQTIRDILSGM